MSDGEDDNGNKEESKTADDKEDKDKKKRRPVVKLDEERLLGPNGFPALLEQYKRFKPTGKGNEAKDLQRLLQMYQLWSHKMYPKTQFRDTAQKIENLCRSRRMHAALSGWKNEPRETSPTADDDTQAIDLDFEADNENDSPEPATFGVQPPPQDKGKGKAPQRDTPAPSAAPSDEWDLDALIAEDEAARAELGLGHTPSIPQISTSTSAPTLTHKTPKSAVATQPEEDDWDMDALIAEVEGQERQERSATVNVRRGCRAMEWEWCQWER
ncbi:hypothetical protein BS47DRAFT_1378805 [Hydnum rufescens UP504]|uniref:Chromosome segregation in meiosis protein n=1 Tax=Hydnum rufescens UP504 TaxID=1448309 RepID=A0A9P6BA96_9AGAM|nr:hypothetical protein BS47DRAFT_1378805 [Hydnum rufescens UP504]